MISPGCANCYAAARNHRFGMDNWGKGKPRRRTSAANWRKPLAWNRQGNVCVECGTPPAPDCECGQIGAIGKTARPRIFPSLCDWLDDEVPIELLADFLRVIRQTPNLAWLLLTKRPENCLARIEAAQDWHFDHGDRNVAGWLSDWRLRDTPPPSHIWLGTSVEDRPRKTRIDELRKTPAKVRFLSLEPLLEDLGELDLRGIRWVIVGGESGPGARPCNVDWVRSIVGQCRAAGVPCFVKQLGSIGVSETTQGWPPGKIKWDSGAPHAFRANLKHPKGGDPDEWPADLRVREFPKV